MRSDFSVVILAAGQGQRMRSTLPKVLHCIGGIPLLTHLVQTAYELSPHRVVVVHALHNEPLKAALKDFHELEWALQSEQKGTGHAVLAALPFVGEAKRVLVLYGDGPLIEAETLDRFLTETQNNLGLITVDSKAPQGLGRIIRDKAGNVTRIVNEKDATPLEKTLTEIWPGICLAPKKSLESWLPKLKLQNAAKEYYLTDILPLALSDKLIISTTSPKHEYEVFSANDKEQLAFLERCYQGKEAQKLMAAGVTLLDPARLDIRGKLNVGQDVVIDVNVVFEGKVKVGNGVSIGPNVIIKDSHIHDGVKILANSLIEGAEIGAGATVGPFARIRPGTKLGINTRVGNFVEIKQSSIGTGTKVNHLSYIGDASLGEHVNIGAGTITCNFDGEKKHQTVIGNHVSVGADTQFIAPVTVGEGAKIGAGTTITKDIPANQLIHNRIQYRQIENWMHRKQETELKKSKESQEEEETKE